MIDPAAIPSDARLYLRPEQFVDTPVGRDGEVARLAGGLVWFAAYALIAVAGGYRVFQASVPVAGLPALIANLPEAQAARLRMLAERISAPRPPLRLGERVVRLDQPGTMGLLDATSGDAAIASLGFDMAAAGAAIVEVGGEPARPGAAAVWEGDEIARVAPVVSALAATGTPVAVSTRKAAVMEGALAAGASLVSDAAALQWDARAAEVVARAGCPVVLAYASDGSNGDVLVEAFDWLDARVEAVAAAGVDRAAILIDPGVGPGRTLAENLALLNGLAMLHGIGCGIVLGVSRDRTIGALSNEAPAEARLPGSIALALHGADRGVQLLRVHDVAETMQALRVWRGLRDAALTALP